MSKSPYDVIKHRVISEKASMLSGLKDAESNKSLKRCKSPKYVFVVASDANKIEIKSALESIYEKQKITVVSVNTINTKAKPRLFRGRFGRTKPYKKAIVTLKEGDSLDETA